MQIQPYLFFDGRCDEAIAFYKKALGAEQAMLMRFKDAPDPAMAPPERAEKVMHAQLRIGDAMMLMSDGACGGQAAFQGFGLSLTADNPGEAERLFAKLSDGGEVQMPMAATFFSPAFGMVSDRFGVMWMVYVPA